MGMALAFGVLFDAFVVRMMLIPALTKLFGKGSWVIYQHGWIALFQRVDIEGHRMKKYKTGWIHRNLNLKDSRETYDTTFKSISQGVQQMYRNIIRCTWARWYNSIVLDDKTMALQEVKQRISKFHCFLEHDALMDYQNKHQLNSKQQTTNIEQLKKILKSLNQLLEKLKK